MWFCKAWDGGPTSRGFRICSSQALALPAGSTSAQVHAFSSLAHQLHVSRWFCLLPVDLKEGEARWCSLHPCT